MPANAAATANIDELNDNCFSCGETPVWFPNDFSLDTLGRCESCIVRLNAPTAGPGQIQRVTDNGLEIDENGVGAFFYNGLQHNLFETRLMIPAAHRLPGEAEVADAELQCYFRGQYNPSVIYCICLLLNGTKLETKSVTVQKGKVRRFFSSKDTTQKKVTEFEPGHPYFQRLGDPVGKPRTSLNDLFGTVVGTGVYSYLGADLRNRSNSNQKPRDQCEPIKQKVTYMVCMNTAKIGGGDLERLRSRLRKRHPGPPIPPSGIPSRIQQLVTIIPNLKVGDDQPVAKRGLGPVTSGIPTNQVKCRRIDVDKDIQGNRIILGSEKRTDDTTLEQELNNAADMEKSYEDQNATIQAGDVEYYVGMIIGSLIAIVVCAFVAFYGLKWTFRRYEERSVAGGPAEALSRPLRSAIATTGSFFGGLWGKICGKD